MSPKSDLEDFEGNHWQPANSRTFSIYEFQGQSKSTVFSTEIDRFMISYELLLLILSRISQDFHSSVYKTIVGYVINIG